MHHRHNRIDRLADALLAADEADAPFDDWTLDELERSADLSPPRSAWAPGEDPNE